MGRRDRKQQGGVHLLPGEVIQVSACGRGSDLRVTAGRRIQLASEVFPPAPEDLAQALGRSREPYSLAAAVDVRTSKVELPPLSAEETGKGAGWAARQTFRTNDVENAFDYEILPTAEDHGAVLARDALLVAVPRTSLNVWRSWVSELPRGPVRLEPTLPAWLRALRWIAERDVDLPPTVYLHDDAGGSLAAVLQGPRVLIGRTLAPGPDTRPRWRGEDGLRVLRETILAAEDRHPWVELERLVAFGDIEDEWLEEAAVVTGLERAPKPAPPPGTPVELEPQARWAVPFGAILGAHP